MDLILQFQNLDIQNVKTFNEIFKYSPILELDDLLEVEICDLTTADRRIIKVGDKVIKMSLKQTKRGGISKDCKNAIVTDRKPCSKCFKVLFLDQFSPHKKSKYGRRSACKDCCVKIVTACKLKKNEIS